MEYEEYDYEDFLERLDLKRRGIIPDYRPFSPSRYPALLKLYDQLDAEMKILFNHMFKQPTKPKTKKPIIQDMDDQFYDYDDFHNKLSNQQFQKIKFEEIIPLQLTKTDMPTCNQIFQKGQHAYKCYDCQKVSVCVWCVICFEESEHRGHRYTMIPVQAGGTCDCGNSQSMNPSGFCRKHKGKYSEPMIDQKERNQFFKYIGNIWHWITLMYEVEHLNSIVVLIHLCIYLDKLNEHCLIYNVLTQQLLSKGKPMMIDCLFEWGAKHYDTLLSKYANEMLLKMFSVPSVKDFLTQKFILHYNKDFRFQVSDFRYLFIQLFINHEILQRVIPRINQSIAPRNREYDTKEYNFLLKNTQSFRKESAKIFFKPIIESGGIDQGLMRYIEETIEKSTYNMDYIYKEQKYSKYDNSFYQVMSIVSKIHQDQPQMLQKQMLNQVELSRKYMYKKNKVVIPHHRSFCLLVFVYFQCNLEQINSIKVRNILGYEKKKFVEFIVQNLKFLLRSMKEFALTLANRDDSKYEFDAYVGLYAADPLLSQVFLYDILGLKVLSMLLYKQNQQQQFGTALELVYKQEREKIDKDQMWLRRDIQNTQKQINSERQMMKKHYKGRNMPYGMMEDMEMQRYVRHGSGVNFGRGSKNQSTGQFIRQCQQKLAISAKTHFLEWVHFMHLLIQATLTERSEVIIAARCGINNVKTQQINQRQMISLFKNVKYITVQELQTLYPFWFGKQINKEILHKVATFDKTKKKYTIKQNIEGTPIFKDLFHSFLGNDTYLKYTSKPIELTNIHRCLISTILSEKIISTFLQRLFQSYRTKNFSRTAQQIRYFAGLIKLIGFVFGTQKKQSQQMKKRILEIAQNFNIEQQISLIFDQQAEIISKQKSEVEKKRLQQIKKKQKEKFNNLKKNATENNKKILENQIEKLDLQLPSTEQCYICKGKGDLFYLGLYGQSSFMFNTLHLNGTYPYFHSCFHTIHFGCYLELCKDSDKIACPLCKSVSNILLPSQISLQKNPTILNFMNERLEIISTIESKEKQVENLNLHLSKCFVHLFFLNLLEKSPLHQKKTRLYKMILQFLSKRYQQFNQVQKQKYEHQLISLHQIYKSEMNTSYPVDQLMKFVNQLTLKTIKKQPIDSNYLTNLLKNIDHLPQIDIIKILNFSVQIYGINKDFQPKIKEKQACIPLSQGINFYRPPKNVKQLLKLRGFEEGKCKFGHNAAICIICNWKGCGDCTESIQHSTEKHCKRSIFFNFITGGIIYIANTKRFKIDCIYISQISGRPWLAKQKEDDYVLDVELYDQLLQSLVQENLMEFMTSHLKGVNVADLF